MITILSCSCLHEKFSLFFIFAVVTSVHPFLCHKSGFEKLFCIQVGLSHSNILRSIIYRACSRFPKLASFRSVSRLLAKRSTSSLLSEALPKREGTRKVFVIFGGDTSERQVSLMSGTNVWLNLQAFDDVSTTYYIFIASAQEEKELRGRRGGGGGVGCRFF